MTEQEKKALDCAARLLAPRAMSEKALRDKLAAKGFAPEEIAYAAERMISLGALNDEEYARMVMRHYVNRGFGRQKVAQELHRRGVPHEVAQQILPEVAPNSSQIELYLKKTIGSQYEDKKRLQRAAAGLYRRGFSWEQINGAIGAYCSPEMREDEESAETEE